jgi:hypothetical protein
VGQALAYHPQVCPYYFNDNDGDGEASASEATRPNQYNAWMPRLLRSAYNYQYVIKDPGAYAHNPDYTIEHLHDSLESLSAKVPVRMESMTRPEPPS